jgi:hypothetical protein
MTAACGGATGGVTAGSFSPFARRHDASPADAHFGEPEEIGGDGVRGGMRTPTVTEIPLSLARVEPDPFIEAPCDRPDASGKKSAPPASDRA